MTNAHRDQHRHANDPPGEDCGWRWHLVTATAIALLVFAVVLIWRYDDRPHRRIPESKPAETLTIRPLLPPDWRAPMSHDEAARSQQRRSPAS